MMDIFNIEIKAHCDDHERIRKVLIDEGAKFSGKDHQQDIYYCSVHGRLKLRKGNVENALIHYFRPDHPGPKSSEIVLYKTKADASLGSLLEKALGVLTIVDKQREIYFLGNIKFHLDEVKGLGKFIEIEVIDTTGHRDRDDLLDDCKGFIEKFGIRDEDCVAESYSDMLLEMESDAEAAAAE